MGETGKGGLEDDTRLLQELLESFLPSPSLNRFGN